MTEIGCHAEPKVKHLDRGLNIFYPRCFAAFYFF